MIIKSGELEMLEYYIRQSLNMGLSESEREQYSKMADKMSDKVKAQKLKDQIKRENDAALMMAEVEDDSCAGGACKI